MRRLKFPSVSFQFLPSPFPRPVNQIAMLAPRVSSMSVDWWKYLWRGEVAGSRGERRERENAHHNQVIWCSSQPKSEFPAWSGQVAQWPCHLALRSISKRVFLLFQSCSWSFLQLSIWAAAHHYPDVTPTTAQNRLSSFSGDLEDHFAPQGISDSVWSHYQPSLLWSVVIYY